MAAQITPADMSRHCSKDDVWIIIDGKVGGNKVYDMSSYITDHPGGEVILATASLHEQLAFAPSCSASLQLLCVVFSTQSNAAFDFDCMRSYFSDAFGHSAQPLESRSLRYGHRGAAVYGRATGEPLLTVWPPGNRPLRGAAFFDMAIGYPLSLRYSHRRATFYGMATGESLSTSAKEDSIVTEGVVNIETPPTIVRRNNYDRKNAKWQDTVHVLF
ncbi:hypothetical protein LSAT2_015006 [Lamellibrachia satsuma]|nr:hypothetical protein LSAT2_015006 [Lamellibrachia satsuma]